MESLLKSYMMHWLKVMSEIKEKPVAEKNTGPLKLIPVDIDDSYRQQWNCHPEEEFYHLYLEDKKLRNTLYRQSILTSNINKSKYFLISKNVEDHYSDQITTDPDEKPHLKSIWVIMNEKGEELIEFDSFKSPYIIEDSVIYTIDNGYYNIETGELICSSHNTMITEHYLFLENPFDNDESKCGVIIVDKKTGSYQVKN